MKPLPKSILAICVTMAISAEIHAQPRAGNWYQQQPAANNYYGNGYQPSQYTGYQYPTQQYQQQRPGSAPPTQQRQTGRQQQQQQHTAYKPTPSRDNNSQWLSNFDAAMATAQKQGRPLVALFVHHGCPECDRMDAILAQPGAAQNFDNAVKARIEFTQNAEVVHRLGLKFTPTLIVFSPDGGGEVYREVGAITADRLRLLKPSIDSMVTGPKPESETRTTSKRSRSAKETSQADNTDNNVTAL